jgi:hypothetical protein
MYTVRGIIHDLLHEREPKVGAGQYRPGSTDRSNLDVRPKATPIMPVAKPVEPPKVKEAEDTDEAKKGKSDWWLMPKKAPPPQAPYVRPTPEEIEKMSNKFYGIPDESPKVKEGLDPASDQGVMPVNLEGEQNKPVLEPDGTPRVFPKYGPVKVQTPAPGYTFDYDGNKPIDFKAIDQRLKMRHIDDCGCSSCK